MTENKAGAEGIGPGELAAALERVANGDRVALALVYRETSAKLLGVCLRILKDRNEAEDVLQDVYVTVWKRADAYRPERGGAIAWLCAVARNRSIDRMRLRRPASAFVDVTTLEMADAAPTPEQHVQGASERAKLHGCLDQLEGNARTVIRTAFFEGVTYEALAGRMGAPLGTVKSWVRRGLMRLRTCLEA